MIRLIIMKALIVVALLTNALQAQAISNPEILVKNTIDDLIKVSEELPGEANAVNRRSKMRVIVSEHFDFKEMSKRSLGPYWNKIDAAEQEKFVTVFSDLLAKTYIKKVDEIKKNMVSVDSSKVKEPRAIVKTTVLYKNETFPLEYRLVYKDNAWKVYDVVIENIGLVSNYRGEFAGILRKEKFSGLMTMLEKKVAKL